ncbi:MAG: hypothetical protein AAB588_00945 [Patescibacteria group bacterium]
MKLKKALIIFAILTFFVGNVAVFAATKPTQEEYEAAASIASDGIICPENFEEEVPEQWKILEYEFLKKPTQRITQACMDGSGAFLLREEQTPNGKIVKAGMFLFGGNYKYLERRQHVSDVYCELITEPDENSLFHVKYRCYNPTVGSGTTPGKEYSFSIRSGKTYFRTCTVTFDDGVKFSCGSWKLLKASRLK